MNKTMNHSPIPESKHSSESLSIFSLAAQVRSYIKEFIENLPPLNAKIEDFIEEFTKLLIIFKNKLAKNSSGDHLQKHFINSIISKIEQLQKILSLEMVSPDMSMQSSQPQSLALD